MSFSGSSSIATDPSMAFDLMADARNEPAWNSQVSRSTLDSPEPVAAGSRFTTVNRGRAYAATITTYDKPNVLVFEVTGGGMDITTTFRFAPDGEDTRLDSEFDFRPKGFMKLVFPLLTPAIRKDVPKQAANFKAFCENPAPPS